MRVYNDLTQLPDFQQTVVTIGSFDGVHSGHRRILEQVAAIARKAGVASVVITFDPHPRTVLGNSTAGFHLINTTQEKIDLIRQCGIDHLVVTPFTQEFAALSAKDYVEDFLIKRFQPHTIVIGYDHRFGNDRKGDLHFLQQYADAGQFTIVEIPAQEVDDITVSSSKIRKALDACDITNANKLLAHPFVLSGKVVEGNKIGRTIGFPTANLDINDQYKLIPPTGIYACYVQIEKAEQRLRGMLYIGDRPTIEGATERRVEVNILDFDGDLYGKNLRLEVVDFIRGDKKLDSLAALKSQIAADQVAIEQRLSVFDWKEVAIVILNYNTRAHLATYLPSVVKFNPGARIIVADNGSPDDSVSFVHHYYPQVEIIDLQSNWGFAEGYNRALAQVEAKYYVILNSDVEVTAGWMEPILSALEADPTIAVAQPKILAEQQRDRFEYAGAAGGWIDTLGYPFCRGRIFNHVEQDIGQYDSPQACFWASGAAFFIRASLFQKFGGFDADYFAHNEEIDLCWRLKRAGYSVWCFPKSTVYHLGGGTLGYQSPRKTYLNFRNSLFTLIKNESTGKLLWLIPARFVLDGVAAAMFLTKRQTRNIKAIWDAHIAFYKGFRNVLQKRKSVAAIVAENKLPGKKADQSGVYRGSIVFAHYLRRIKEYGEIYD